MSAIQYVALCAKDRTYLKITNSGYFTTKNAASAFRNTEAQVEARLRLLKEMGFDMSNWMVMRSKDAAKIVPGLGKPDDAMIYLCNAKPKEPLSLLGDIAKQIPPPAPAKPAFTTPVTKSAADILEAAKQLQALMGPAHTAELSKELSRLDKYVVDAYHYIEVSNLNAAQGYKAYKRLKDALIARRKVKNEMDVIRKINQCGVRDLDRLSEISTRAWEPQIDLIAEV